ncbi:MAG: protein kinase [candidate division KSB1 bacterium]|nr:protein kinase [candidate division KSB1 bacterium]
MILAHAPVRGQSAPDSLQFYQDALSEKDSPSRIHRLQELVQQYPAFKEARYALAAELYRIKRYEEAIPHFEAVMRLDAEFARKVSAVKYLVNAHIQRAVQLIAAGQPEKAIEVLKKAEKFDASHAILQYNLGNAYYQLNRFKEAIGAYQRAIAAGVLDAGVKSALWYNLAGAYYALENYPAAVQAYERALQWNPNLTEAKANLKKARLRVQLQSRLQQADSALAANDAQLARQLAQSILAQDSTVAQARSIYAEADRRIRYDQALRAMDAQNWSQALRLLRALPVNYLDVAELRQMVGRQMRLQRQRQVQEQLDRVLELMQARQVAEARKLLQKVARDLPNDPRVTAYMAHLDSLQVRTPQAGRPATAAVTESVETLSSDTTGAVSTGEVVASKTPVAGEANRESAATSGMRRTSGSAVSALPFHRPLIWALLGTLVIALIGYMVHRSRRRRAREADMRAALRQTAAKTAAVAEDGSAAAPEPPDRVADTEVVEKEMLDLVAGGDTLTEPSEPPKETAESERGEQANVAEVSESDFLAILQEEELPGTLLQDDTETGGMPPAGDVTRTVDMSQFRIRKIGRYVLEKEIGRGAAGRIYKAWDPKLDRTVVIKTVSYRLTASEDEISRLKARVYREAKTAAKLNHPNIVVVYDVEDEKNFSYIVMEYVEGPNLRELLNQEHRIDPCRAIRLVKQVCQALEFAHASGVVHRDIKPSNILIVDSEKVKVTDFGIAKVINHLTLTQTGRVVGTPSYMAPEQIEGGQVDSRSDIFSLGVVFYELITGKRPFEGESLASLAYKIVHVDPVPPSLVNVELSEVYDEIINRAMAKDPSQRFQTAVEFYKALEKVETAITS